MSMNHLVCTISSAIEALTLLGDFLATEKLLLVEVPMRKERYGA
jgi:hypothetical protein